MFYTYILASGRNGTLYIGSTQDLLNRIHQHKAKAVPGFTAKYGVDQLVWYEPHTDRHQVFRRERQIKEWRRLWKLQLIERTNPNWLDLAEGLEERLSREEMLSMWQDVPGSRLSPG
ncbi:GIY-YIG nuclease family protein [Caulobacter sp. KR2-114]|uniref:GIY-YIG nuclease family protein n=1 Tax=Caulobacter sp. KR2-114 TaxID=3400912 RepID=UPI003C0434B9